MKDLVNPNVLELMPYKPGKPVDEIQRKFNLEKVVKLASNENPFSVSPQVAEAIKKEIGSLNMYPCSDSYYLKETLAQYLGVDVKNVIIGAGSVEVIGMITSAFLKPGEKVLTSEKTFLMYRIAAVAAGGKKAFVEVPTDQEYRFDLDAMAAAIDEKTKVIFIANPNNPTGTLLPKQKLVDFIQKVPEDRIIVLDNAYQEYVSDMDNYADGLDFAVNRKNVVVLRTFSKIYALSGLRIGYAVGHEKLIAYLARVKAPFNVTRVAQVAAIASLKDDEFKNKSAALNIKNREKLYNQLVQLGLKTVPSETNFLMFFPGVNPMELNDRLLRQGVIIRPVKAFGVPDGMRVTVGFEEDNDFFIQKLERELEALKK